MFRNAMFTLLGLALLSPSSILAQDLPLREFYGQGVHAYFAGDYKDALVDLSAAADGGSNDPRVYYFKALTLIQLDSRASSSGWKERMSASTAFVGRWTQAGVQFAAASTPRG